MFATLEKRVRGLHPALAPFASRTVGAARFCSATIGRRSSTFIPQSRNAIVLGAYAGHGVALSTYLGAWAAEALLGRRELPAWGAIRVAR